MAKKPAWDRKPCGCVKTKLPVSGKVFIRCVKHRDKPYDGTRTLCHWDDLGIVRRA